MTDRVLSGFAALPQELHDAIVDHWHADKRTLKICSRVCRSWLSPSRYHIFSRVLLHPHNIAVFLQLLSSPHCTIRPFVTRLAVEQGPNRYGGDLLWFKTGLPQLSGFSSVRFLHLLGLGLYNGDISHMLMTALRNHYDAVTDLEINHGVFRSFSQFASVITCFPNIERLALETIVWKDRTIPPPAEQRPLCRLKSLMFKSSYMIDILNWLLSHKHLPPINTIHLDYIIWPEDTIIVNDFFCRLGPHLEHLRLDDASVYDLSHNNRLRSVYINRSATPGSGGDWITTLISTIKSPRMESIVLKMSFFFLNDLDIIDWANLEDSFSQPHFANLQKIELCLPWSPTDWMIVSAIRGKLQSCEARGLICLSRPTVPPTPFADYLHPIVTSPTITRSSATRRTFWLWLRRVRMWSCSRNLTF